MIPDTFLQGLEPRHLFTAVLEAPIPGRVVYENGPAIALDLNQYVSDVDGAVTFDVAMGRPDDVDDLELWLDDDGVLRLSASDNPFAILATDEGLRSQIVGTSSTIASISAKHISPNGRYVTATGLSSDLDWMVLLTDLHTGLTRVIAEDQHTPDPDDPGDTLVISSATPVVNDQGHVLFQASTDQRMALLWDGESLSVPFRQGDAMPDDAGVYPDARWTSLTLTNEGDMGGVFGDVLIVDQRVVHRLGDAPVDGYVAADPSTTDASFVHVHNSPDTRHTVLVIRTDDPDPMPEPTDEDPDPDPDPDAATSVYLMLEGEFIAQSNVTPIEFHEATGFTYGTSMIGAVNNQGDWVAITQAFNASTRQTRDVVIHNGAILQQQGDLAPDGSGRHLDRVMFSTHINARGDVLTQWSLQEDGTTLLMLNGSVVFTTGGTRDIDLDGRQGPQPVTVTGVAFTQLADDGTITATVTTTDGNALVKLVDQPATSKRAIVHLTVTATGPDDQSVTTDFKVQVKRGGVPNEFGDPTDVVSSDVLFRNPHRGTIEARWLRETTDVGGIDLKPMLNTHQVLAATADFNGDGHTDFVWRDVKTGQNKIWLMHGAEHIKSVAFRAQRNTDWIIGAAGDFDGDGDADLVWRNLSTGRVSIWSFHGTTWVESTRVNFRDHDRRWVPVGAADFNQDGTDDMIWKRRDKGRVIAVHLQDRDVKRTHLLRRFDSAQWNLGMVGDFNQDGLIDLAWHRTDTNRLRADSYVGFQFEDDFALGNRRDGVMPGFAGYGPAWRQEDARR